MGQADWRELVESTSDEIYQIRSKAPGPQGRLPLTDEMLRYRPCGDVFGWIQNVGMGWDPNRLGGPEVLILSTHGGLRASDGTPVALGYHTGHWEVALLVQEAAEELKSLGAIPFAGYCSDPCDGRTQGTSGMFDSLPYRNDAASVLGRLIRSLPTRQAVIGIATCDKGLPAMMMALAGARRLPAILVPGGVTLLAEEGEDAGKVQSIGARYAQGEVTLDYAQEVTARACASPGGGCQFLGTAATSQVVGEALGLCLPHSALAPSGSAAWREMARRAARAVLRLVKRGIPLAEILTEAAIHNALVTHAAFGGSTNLILHLPAIAHAAGLRRPTLEDWERINRQIPRLVDALPNGPQNFPTSQVFLAGAVPEVMLHLRRAGLLETRVLTVTGATLDEVLDWWESSERRRRFREILRQEGVDPNQVIMSPEDAARNGLTSTVCFPRGNLCPGGSVIKATAIDPSVIDPDGVYRMRGPARVFTSEREAIAAVKGNHPKPIRPGDVVVLICRGPMGSGMEEEFQLTSALRYISWGKHVALLTDGRFSGVSTGACIGHVTPEALAGGPIGKLRDGDLIEIIIDRHNLTGSVNFVGYDGRTFDPEEGARILASRPPREDLLADPELPDATRLWAALQEVSGGTWGGCVFDVDRILELLEAGKRALARQTESVR